MMADRRFFFTALLGFVSFLFVYLITKEAVLCRSSRNPQSPEDQLRSLDKQYVHNLNFVFWDHVRWQRSGSALSQNFTAMMMEYREQRSGLVNAVTVLDSTNENDIERLLYLQTFIIDFANDPDSRNATELKEGLAKYGTGGIVGFKPDCLQPYPSAEKLMRMYYKAIHFKLTNCVIEFAPPTCATILANDPNLFVRLSSNDPNLHGSLVFRRFW